MKYFEKPVMNVCEFDAENIVTESSLVTMQKVEDTTSLTGTPNDSGKALATTNILTFTW